METILHRLKNWADSSPSDIAQRFKVNGVWQNITAQEMWERVYHLCLFLESKGMSTQDVGCIFSPNNAQWVHVDLATVLLGAKSAGLYPNANAKDVKYILEHTESRFISVYNREFFDKVAIPERTQVILVFDGSADFHPRAISYRDALAAGERLAGRAKAGSEYLKSLDPDAPAFMIYTSGTTGNPKGALLSNDNLCYTSDLVIRYWDLPKVGSLFSFLPLCHVAEKLQCIGVGISRQYTVSYCTKFDNLMVELPEVEPTLLLCVPRLWEKMMEGVLGKVNRSEGAKKKLALWALEVGAQAAEIKYAKKTPALSDFLRLKIADRLVLSKIRKALGLGRAECLASGAAALPAHVSKWFRSLQLEILEDFGQTESTGVISMTERGVDAAGTVGKVLPGIEMRIAEDGEVLTRGRNVFKGYYKDEAALAQVLEKDGWLHTGDLGEIDARGFLKIRGRKKEILKTSGGKMIAPLPIEEALKTSAIISQVCIVGDGRKYLSALVTLSEAKLADLKTQGCLGQATVSDPKTLEAVKFQMDKINSELAGYEQIKRFTVLSREFSIVEGEMTPTLKMKRNVIENNYRAVIDGMYQG